MEEFADQSEFATDVPHGLTCSDVIVFNRIG